MAMSEAFVTVLADTGRFEDDVTAALRPIMRRVERQLRRIRVRVALDPISVAALVRDTTRLIRTLTTSLPPISLRVVPDLDPEDVAALRARLAALNGDLDDITVRVRVDEDRDGERSMNALVDTAARATRGALGLSAGLLKLAAGFSAAGLAAGVTTLAISGLVTAVPGVLASLQELTGGINTFLAAGAGVAAVGITLKVAFKGFGDALSAISDGDPEKIAEALKTLAPAARLVAKEFIAAKPALRSFQQAVQQSLFKELRGSLTGLVGILPKIQKQVNGLATELGKSGGAFARFFADPVTVRDLNTILANTARLVAPVTSALLNLVDTGLSRAADGSATVGERFAAMGRAIQSVGAGLNKLGQFFIGFDQTVAPVIFPFLLNVTEGFGKLTLGAEGFIGLGQRVGRMVAPFAQLAVVFLETAAIIGVVVLPVLLKIAQAVANLDVQVTVALRPALEAVLPLFTTIGEVVAVVAPLLGTVLAGAAAGLGSVIQVIIPFVQQLLNQIGPLLAQVAPVASDLIDAVSETLVTLAEELLPLVIDLMPHFINLIVSLLPLGTFLANVLRDLVVPAIRLVARGLPPVIGLIGGLTDLLAGLITVTLSTAIGLQNLQREIRNSEAFQWLMGQIGQLIDFFASLASYIGNAASALGGFLSKAAQAASVSGILGSLPFFADGGIVGTGGRGTLAVVGEAGPEVIIPLSKGTQRAQELADQSGLTALLQNSGGGQTTVVIQARDRTLAQIIDVRVIEGQRAAERTRVQGTRR